jgi:IS5 family transposase
VVNGMDKQQSLADIEYGNRKRTTKRDEFLSIMDEVIPWDEWMAAVEPYYPSGKRGRPPRGVETMLRMYLLANWFNLSDEGVEDAIYDSYAFRKFMGIDFLGDAQVPDATTLCKFRKTLNEKGITKLLFDTTKVFLERHGKVMHGGTIVDATIIEAPTSTKNAQKQRDPDMHQVKKGNEWHFGERLHVGVDAGTGYVHSMEVTAANTSERDIVPRLIREDDEVVYGDAGYTGLAKRAEIQADSHLARIDYRTNTRNRLHWKTQAPGFDWDRHIEYQKSRVRSKVEYVFLILKRLFGYRKVRYRGLEKNRTHAFILGSCANLFMLAQSGWRMGIEAT